MIELGGGELGLARSGTVAGVAFVCCEYDQQRSPATRKRDGSAARRLAGWRKAASAWCGPGVSATILVRGCARPVIPDARLTTMQRPRPQLERRWAVLVAATLAFAVALGCVRFGFSLTLPAMQAALGLSAAEMGLIAGCSLAAYLCCSIPAGVLATRFGARRTVSGGLLVAALGVAVTALADGVPLLTVGQVIAGGAIAAVIVPALSISPGWFPPASWGLATGVVVAGGGLGFAVSGVLVPLLLQLDPVEGWRFAWVGLLVLVLGAMVLAFGLLREPPRHLRRPPLLASLREVIGLGQIWHLGGIFFLYGWAYITFGTFFSGHLVLGRGLSTWEAGQLWALNGLAGIPGALVAGLAADRLGHRPTLALIYAAQGVSLLMLGLGTSWGWYAASAVLYGFTIWSFAGVISAACGLVAGPALAAAAVALAVTLMGIGQVIGPVVGGLTANPDGSFTTAFVIASLADLAGVVGALLLRLPRRSA
jgi:MFS family permease